MILSFNYPSFWVCRSCMAARYCWSIQALGIVLYVSIEYHKGYKPSLYQIYFTVKNFRSSMLVGNEPLSIPLSSLNLLRLSVQYYDTIIRFPGTYLSEFSIEVKQNPFLYLFFWVHRPLLFLFMFKLIPQTSLCPNCKFRTLVLPTQIP